MNTKIIEEQVLAILDNGYQVEYSNHSSGEEITVAYPPGWTTNPSNLTKNGYLVSDVGESPEIYIPLNRFRIVRYWTEEENDGFGTVTSTLSKDITEEYIRRKFMTNAEKRAEKKARREALKEQKEQELRVLRARRNNLLDAIDYVETGRAMDELVTIRLQIDALEKSM